MPDDDELSRRAEEFANALSGTVRGVLGTEVPDFEAVYEKGRRGDQRLVIRTKTPAGSPSPAIPIKIDDKLRLEVTVTLLCAWDSDQHFLAIEKSSIHVRMAGNHPEPLFRWEYVRNPTSSVPSAHFHLHAHRDEIVYLLLTGGEGNRRVKKRAQQVGETSPTIPRLSALHLPLGGPRFRPCLEDVLQFLILEFGIDRADDWENAIHEGRRNWRRVQTGVVVRDSPDEAVRVLKELGYTIEAPQNPPPESAKIILY